MNHTRSNRRRVKDVIKKERGLHWKQLGLTSFISLIVLTAALSGLWSLNQKLSIKHWTIYAAAPLKADIEHALKGMKELDFWHSRPALLRTQLLDKVPDLADIQIQRQLPNRLVIHVTPRQAIALWSNKNGFNKNTNNKQEQLYLVDEHGIPYRARKHGEPSDLPVLRMQQNYLVAACQWLTALKKEQPQWFTRSSELFATPTGWKLNLVAGQQWHIPFGPRGLKDITQLSNILKQPRWHVGNWRIDTRLGNRWFLRPATHEGVI
ncbi:MAG: FtsQ-type POTRA domain-containing protein [Mariprofundaceae bacterium]|nr:FtsQ-type POTRA domain-containing protein [Mariprofundaceae bacterium]